MKSVRSGWKRCLIAPLILIASLVMWIEESLWNGLKWLMAILARLTWIRYLESLIQRLSPAATVVVFLLPLTLLFPFKLLALYWLSRGQWLASLSVLIAAKLLGTALEARMFVLCRPQLLMLPWFKWLHDGFLWWHDRLYAAFTGLKIYQLARAQLTAIKQAAQSLIRQIRQRWHEIKHRSNQDSL